jgi:hypothetical protein
LSFTLLRKLRRFQQLNLQQKQILLYAAALLTADTFLMKLADFKRIYKFAATSVLDPAPRSSSSLAPIEIAELVQMASGSILLSPTCLVRSLVLWQLLRRHSFQSSLCVGVRKENNTLSAHAWIEYEGVVLNDQADIRDRFAVFDFPIDQVMRMRFS